MTNRKRISIHGVIILILAFLCTNVHAQRLEDSLRNIVNQKSLPLGTRVETMVRLAQAVFFNKDWTEGQDIYREAIAMAAPLKDGKYRAHAYGALALSFSITGDSEASDRALDSAFRYSKRTTSKTSQGYVLYCKGWLESRAQKEPQAMQSFQQALDLFEQEPVTSLKFQQTIYGEMVGIYFHWYDLPNVEKYTRLALETAKKLNLLDKLITANQDRGSYFINMFRNDESQRVWLDSALYYMRTSLNLAMNNRERLITPSDIPFSAIGISNIFLAYFPKTKEYKDSIDYYNEIALVEGKRTKQFSVQAGVYNMLGSIAQSNNDYNSAIAYYNQALSVSITDPMADKFNLSQSFLGVAEAYDKRGDTAQALHHYKQYMKLYEELFDASKMNKTKELEARYENAKKEKALLEIRLIAEQRNRELIQARLLSGEKDQALLAARYAASEKDKALLAARFETEQKQLALTNANFKTAKREQELRAMEERMNFNRKMNRIYAALAVALLLVLLFLFYAYKQRSKTLKQAKRLHEFEVDKMKQEHRISNLSAMLEGQEQERSRLARDLHDGLGGLLSGVKIQLSGLTPLVKEEKQQTIVSNSLDHLDNAVDELRRIAKSMMPEVLLTYGLGEATREYCNGLKKSGIAIDCQVVRYKNDMDHSRQVTLYRIMQELVNNAVKHAAASQILVQLQQSDDHIFLTVEDDGKGLDKSQLESLKGAGLANIRSRVEMLHGRLDLQSAPGTGTTFTIECSIK
ncbi:tetratricopeptide repeat protein [Pseudoflavitalea sp. G-6-1-2]|uniref:ATP-binding protein n=1 Tax=Pseudoflavitalea sp. G-6-1-2 TaxID=2728841 RepID=UPI00146AD3AC|nr:sensor histidine kinase [Pseudoflavitalea sp. G-6-1-2]NML21917.1 tetratricopeptide repeat protein [Pseudoflavitalea sp. G-6-1-2]